MFWRIRSPIDVRHAHNNNNNSNNNNNNNSGLHSFIR